MKSQILKIAGVKKESDFYKLFPTEEAFMKKHGKEFQAKCGAKLHKAQLGMTQQFVNAGNTVNQLTRPPLTPINAYSAGINMSGTEFQPLDLSGRNLTNEYKNTFTGGGMKFDANKLPGAVGGIIGGIQEFNSENTKWKEAKQSRMVSDVMLDAARTRAEEPERDYVRPEELMYASGTFAPDYGTGTVVGKTGIHIKPENKGKFNATKKRTGKTTEELTHSKNPLTRKRAIFAQNAAKWKKGETGSELEKYETGGFANFMNSGGTDVANQFIGAGFNNNAGFQLGSSVGSLIPIPGASAVLGLAGGAIDQAFGPAGKIKKEQKQFEHNVQGIVGSQFGDSMRGVFGGHMRTGGNMRQNSNMDGDLNVYKGSAETISYNPFLPDGGETVMFRGPSHAEGGMPISYGQTGVEVEGGEPAVKLQDGGDAQESLTVFGNLTIPKGFDQIDPKAKGKKFKTYIDDLSKIENKQNKIMDKSLEKASELDVVTPFDKLKLQSLEANKIGATMKLKDIADKKMKAANLQKAINDTADEMGVDAEALSKGKIKKAKYGATMKAQGGANIDETFDQLGTTVDLEKEVFERGDGNKQQKQQSQQNVTPEYLMQLIKNTFPKDQWENAYKIMMAESNGNPNAININKDGSKDVGIFQFNNKWHPEVFENGSVGSVEDQVRKAYKIWKESEARRGKGKGWEEWSSSKNVLTNTSSSDSPNLDARGTFSGEPDWNEIDNQRKFDKDMNLSGVPDFGSRNAQELARIQDTSKDVPLNPVDYKRSTLMDVANQILPYIRPTDAEPLKGNQLLGEMYALATNQLEPVQAQGYRPQLRTPYDISYQDAINEITGQAQATRKMLGYNPAAQSMADAQVYKAIAPIKAEEFRANQAMREGIYAGNTAQLNDAQLKNLAIFDQQYDRQAQAKANTKETAQAALNSISAKYAQNALENKTLQTYENLYNYRYGAGQRAQNWNPLYQPNIPSVGATAGQQQVPIYDAEGNITGYQLTPVKPSLATPDYVKQNARNGSIVKAIKNI